MPIKVMIATSDRRLRIELARLIGGQSDISIPGMEPRLAEALRLLAAEVHDVSLADDVHGSKIRADEIRPYAIRSVARTPAAPAAGPQAQGRLTPRERAVLEQLAKGLAFDQIALALDVSVHTVVTHVKSLYRKLQVRSRGEAVFEAINLGLVRMPDVPHHARITASS